MEISAVSLTKPVHVVHKVRWIKSIMRVLMGTSLNNLVFLCVYKINGGEKDYIVMTLQPYFCLKIFLKM